jgi:hypothetical protein
MTDIKALLEKCQALGATFTPLNDRLKVKAPQPLPDEIMAELKEAKSEILAELHRPSKTESGCWILEEWCRISIPEWRKILKESIGSKNASREEYARWMLGEVLEDPEYKEEE